MPPRRPLLHANAAHAGGTHAERPRAKEDVRSAFRRVGLRMTRQRLAILRMLEARYDHPDVQTLHKSAKIRYPRLSVFTVYRTLNTLESIGLVRRVAVWRGLVRYDAHLHAHAHFLCEHCGRVADFQPGDLGNLRLAAASLGQVLHMDVLVHGREAQCPGVERPATPGSLEAGTTAGRGRGGVQVAPTRAE